MARRRSRRVRCISRLNLRSGTRPCHPRDRISGAADLEFAPLLVQEQFPLNDLMKALLRAAENAVHAKVEIEFALTFQERCGERPQGAAGIPAGSSHGRF